MDFLENEYKKRFSNQHLSDDQIDANDLWAAIEKGLEAPTPSPSWYADWVKKYRLALAFGFLLLLSAVGVFQWVNQGMNVPKGAFFDAPNVAIHAEKQPLSIDTKNNLSNNYQKQTADTPSVYWDKNADKTGFQDKKSDNLLYNYQKPVPTTPSVYSPKNEGKTVFQDKTGNNATLNDSNNTPSVFQDKNAVSTPQNRQLEADNTVSLTSKNQNLSTAETMGNVSQTVENTFNYQPFLERDTVLATTDYLPFLPIKINELTWTTPVFEKLAYENTPVKNRKSKQLEWQLDIASGVNTLIINYLSNKNDAIAALKNETERAQLGWCSSVHLTVVKNDKWRFGTGLSYQQYFSTLDFKQEKVLQVLKKNQLLQIWINTTTGDTVRIRRGDTTVNAFSTREVVHHNTFEQLSIPLTIGLQKRSGNWIYGLNAGAMLNFTLRQSGKILDDMGEFQLFSNGDAIAPLRKSSIGLQISPFLGYNIAKNWSIECHPQWSWQVNNGIGTTDLKANIHQFGVNVQSVWRF